MFDIIDKLQKRAGDLTDQIIELQNQFRKYYIDTYLDMKSKEDIDFENTAPKKRPKLEKPTAPKQIDQVEQNSIESIVHNDAEHILSSSSDIIDDIQARRLQRIKAKNAEFSEVEN